MSHPSGRLILAYLALTFSILTMRQLLGGEPQTPPPDVGPNASLHGRRVFPADDPWNQDISAAAVDPASDAIIASIGAGKPLHPDWGTTYNGQPSGIPYIIVDGKQPKVPIRFTAYGDESDAGPYPVPPAAPIEGGPPSKGDRHVLVLDRDAWMLYELDRAFADGTGWRADCGAVFDLSHPKPRPAGWTSADAAGLPIFPGLVRYDEVMEQKAINHAVRFTVQKSRRGYVHPATHFASPRNDPNLPPMGMRVRLKSDYDISRFPPEVKV